MMKHAGRHVLTSFIMIAGLLFCLGRSEAAIRENQSDADKKKEARMRHIRSSGSPYILAVDKSGTTQELWQYRDPVSGYNSDIAPRRLIVGFKPTTTQTQRDLVLKGFVKSTDSRFSILSKYNIQVVEVPDATNTTSLVAARDTLRRQIGVDFVSLDCKREVQLVPNDPLYPIQQHHTVIQSPQAWDLLAGQPEESEVIIAIVDTGIDLNHEDLADEIWINKSEIPGNGIDDDFNGFIDDVYGWDFSDNDNNPDPGNDHELIHGTHVAGCAAAIGNNGIGLVGSGFRMTLMAVKVFPLSFDTVIAAGVAYAIENGADVINLSLGGYGGGEIFVPVFREANARNIGIVCAAGNENFNIDLFPAVPVSVDGDGNWVTGVAATNNDDTKADFSNYSTRFVDVAAPGVNIYSTTPDDFYAGMSGTSMASPIVAGVMGLLKAYRPNYSIQRLQAAITDFADNIDTKDPSYAGMLGGGRLNSYQSLMNIDIAGIIAEIEPNDDFEEANPIVIGSTVEQAVIDPRRDADFYSFYAEGGDVIEVEVKAQRLEIDGKKSLLQPYLILHAPDRVTEVTRAYNTLPTEVYQGDAFFQQRLPGTGTYYIEVGDLRNPPLGNGNFGGEEYFYQLLIRQLPTHSLPVQKIIAPFSPLTSVIGIDLHYPTGTAFLEQITVRFETAPGSTGKIEPTDFQPLGVDESSGVSIFRDGQGPSEGTFDFTDNEKRDDDLLIVPTEQPILTIDPDHPGVFEVTLKLYNPDVYGTNPNPLTSIPAETDEGLYDFFIVVRTSGNLSHDESFFVTIPPEGLVAVNPANQSCIPFEDQGFGSNSYPEIPKTIFGEVIQFHNFTDRYQTIEQGLDVSSDPCEVIGISAVSPPNDALYLQQVTVTLFGIRPKFRFDNVPNDNIFDRLDLAALSGNESSGIALYRDSSSGGGDGIFDKDQDILIPLNTSKLEYKVEPPVADASTAYRITLIPRDDIVRNRRSLLELPSNDDQPNKGSDFFIVIRTSDRIRDGDTFRVEIRTDPLTGEGGVILSNGSDLISSRREATVTSIPPVFNITARPHPRFTLRDLTGGGLKIKKESKAVAVIGIDAVDFGANQLDYNFRTGGPSDGDTFGWFFDSISVDFLDIGGDGDFDLSDLRPIESDVSKDTIYGEYRSGVAIYMDDSTPIEDGIDDDGDGLVDEELVNGYDDDADGLVDEDCGDDDPAGINGVFDLLDDYIPFFQGSIDKELDPSNPRYPGTGEESQKTGHNFDIITYPDTDETRYAADPVIQSNNALGEHRVTFNMQLWREREIHNCIGGRTISVLEEPIAANFARTGEPPNRGSRKVINNRGEYLECWTSGGISALPEVWHSEGIGMVNAPDPNPCCSRSNAIAILSTYNYVLEIPDDNVGANQGDDYFIVIRTSNTISDGDDFRVRMDSGSIKYKCFKTVDVNADTAGANDIAPGSSGSELITGPIIADVPINLRLNDLTYFGQKVDPLTNAQDAPLEVLGLNLDVAAEFPESEQPGFSDEEISSFVLEFVDETPAKVELEGLTNSIYLGDTILGEITDNADEDYFVFVAPASATKARIQVFAENPQALVLQMNVYDATGDPLISPLTDGVQGDFDITPGRKYTIKVSPTIPPAASGNKAYTLLTWQYAPSRGYFERRGFQISNDLNRSDLAPFTADRNSGIAIYVDDGTQEGRFERFISPEIASDTLIPLTDLTPEITVSGRGTASDPFVYRVEILLSELLRVPFDDFGDTAGSDYYVVIRPGRNITFGDAFRVRLRSEDMNATASIVPVVGETNRLTANVTTIINDLTEPTTRREIVNGSNAPLTTATAIFGLDINDGAGEQEKLIQLKLRFLRGSTGSFTINDIAPITSGIESGVALYRNLGEDDFIEGEDPLVPLQGGFSGSIATLTFTAEGGADVPDSNQGEDAGNDYFIVIRTSENITYETGNTQPDRFVVEIPIDDGIQYTSGFVKKTERTEELTPVLNTGPFFMIVQPSIRSEKPIGGLYALTWVYSDPDGTLDDVGFYISEERPIENVLSPTAVLIPDTVTELPDSAVPVVQSLSLPAEISNGTGVQQLARAAYGPDIQEVYVVGRVSDGYSSPIISYATGTWDVTGATSSSSPVVDVFVEDINKPGQNITVRYSLADSDSPATATLYLGSINGFLNAAGLPNNPTAEEGRDYLILDDTIVYNPEEDDTPFLATNTFPYARLNAGRYVVVIVGKDSENPPVIVIGDRIVEIEDPRWPILLRDPVKASPLVADVLGGDSKEIIVVTSRAGLYFFNEVGGIIAEATWVTDYGTGINSVDSSPALVDFATNDRRLLVAVSEYNSQKKAVGALYLIPIVRTGTTASTMIPKGEIQRLELFTPTSNLVVKGVVSTPAVADIDNDGAPEAVIATGQGDLVAVNLTPTLSVQWRIPNLGAIQCSPAVGHVANDDAIPEIIVYTDQGELYVVESPATGSPVVGEPLLTVGTQPEVYAIAAFSPSLGDVDGDGLSEIVIGTPSLGDVNGRLYIVNGDYQPGGAVPFSPVEVDSNLAAYTVNGQITTAPALADVDGDGSVDIVLLTALEAFNLGDPLGKVYAFTVDTTNRKLKEIFTHNLYQPPVSSPIIADYNPGRNIFFGSSDGRLESIYWSSTNKVTRTPQNSTQTVYDFGPLGSSIVAPPVVCDLNEEATPEHEVVYVTNNPTYALINVLKSSMSLSNPNLKAQWPTFKHDNFRTADIESPLGMKPLIDLDKNGYIDYRDLFLLFTKQWHQPVDRSGKANSLLRDLNNDDPIDQKDLILFMRYWHK